MIEIYAILSFNLLNFFLVHGSSSPKFVVVLSICSIRHLTYRELFHECCSLATRQQKLHGCSPKNRHLWMSSRESYYNIRQILIIVSNAGSGSSDSDRLSISRSTRSRPAKRDQQRWCYYGEREGGIVGGGREGLNILRIEGRERHGG